MPKNRNLLSAGGLKAMYRLMKQASDNMTGSSPDEVLNNFVEVLKRSHPALRMLITIYTPWIMIAMALSKYSLITTLTSAAWDWVMDRLTSKITIPFTHPLQKQVMAWMVQHGLKDARTLALTPPHSNNKRSATQIELDYSLSRHRQPKLQQEEKEVDELLYVPDAGMYEFKFNGYSMRFEKKIREMKELDRRDYKWEDKEVDTVIISCRSPFAGAKPIQAFLEHVKATAAESEDSMTKIFRATSASGYFTWDEGRSRPSRKLTAVTLDASIKKPLVKDIEDYLNPKTKRFYVTNGIPYRKGYLLYGPPGTGKTSFATALAGEYGLNVYLLSLSDTSLTDKHLESLFEQLPAKCIVLMEDIDSAGIKREDMKGDSKPKTKPKKKSRRHREQQRMLRMGDLQRLQTASTMMLDDDPSTDDEQDATKRAPGVSHFSRPGVTLSGLLNVLDGVNAAEGRIVLMTSNDPDSLDKALVRAGRIDRKILFGYASHEVSTKLFTKVFTKSADQLLEGEKPFENVASLVEKFADAVPSGAITPAEIQAHLLTYRADPVACVEAAPEFAREIVEQKKAGKNVAAFDNELEKKDSGVDLAQQVKRTEGNMDAVFGAVMQGFDPAGFAPPVAMPGTAQVAAEEETPGSDEVHTAKSGRPRASRATGGIAPRSNWNKSTASSALAQAVNQQLGKGPVTFSLPTPSSSLESMGGRVGEDDMVGLSWTEKEGGERRDSPLEGSEVDEESSESLGLSDES